MRRGALNNIAKGNRRENSAGPLKHIPFERSKKNETLRERKIRERAGAGKPLKRFLRGTHSWFQE